MKQIHLIQRQILNKLKFSPKLTFSELKPDRKIENNLFNFHLKQLIRLKFIQKEEDTYVLTTQGKIYCAELDTAENKVKTGAMNTVWLICTKIIDDERNLLIYTRKKQPFFGCQGFPAGKMHLGESIEEAAIRELKEESNLEGTPIIKACLHYLTYSEDKSQLIQDKFMYVCHFANPKGTLQDSYEGKFEWIKESQLFEFIKKPFCPIKDYKLVLDIIDSKEDKFFFEEKINTCNVF